MQLDARGCAVLAGLVSPALCRELAGLYGDEHRFRSRVIMGRHGFGRGEYQYFAYPLPPLIAELRARRHPCCCNTVRTITTVCTRIFTATGCFRCS
jgi:uncharacterized protein